MAIKSGQILHVGNAAPAAPVAGMPNFAGQGILIDRLQTAGPGDLNIPEERIKELGNYRSIATIRDVPDLSFSLESLDVSLEIERLLCGATQAATSLDLAQAKPIDIASQFKAGTQAANPFAIVNAVALPHLYLESMSYRFGLRDNATQSATLRGDSIFYIPGQAYIEEFLGTGALNTFTTAYTVLPYEFTTPPTIRRAILSATRIPVSGSSTRLTFGVDFTETAVSGKRAINLLDSNGDPFNLPTGDKLRIVYGSSDSHPYNGYGYNNAGALAGAMGVHQDATIKPATVRGKHIDVFVAPAGYTWAATYDNNLIYKWTDVQSVNVDWRATVERDEEFGNAAAVSIDYSDIPEVTGSIEIRPRGPQQMMDKIRLASGVTEPTQVIGADVSVPIDVHIVVRDPRNGVTPLKRWYLPSVTLTMPGYQGQIDQKLNQTINFSSDTGALNVIEMYTFQDDR